MNVLITSVARKVWLVEAFRRALAPSGGRVLASDADPLSVGLKMADGAVDLPRMDDPRFQAALEDACASYGVGLIIPTRDAELPWFACRTAGVSPADRAERGSIQASQERAGRPRPDRLARVMVSAPETIALSQDKLAFTRHCLDQGFAAAELLPNPTPADLPLFARPRRGAGGRGAARIDDAETLARLTPREDWVIQRLIKAPEFTIDLFADFDGRVLSIVPRQRLRVAAGESVVGVTVEAPVLLDRAAALAQSLGLIGHNTLQCFWDGAEPLWIEVNPRFGGGAALGFAAGADTPAMLLRLLAGERLEPRIGDYERGLYLYRYSTDHFAREAA